MLRIVSWSSCCGATKGFLQPVALSMLVGAFALSSAYGQRNDGGGGDIIVWDIVDSVAKAESRPAGGGGGGDIIVFDIVDNVAKAESRPAGGGVGGDIVVFDIVDNFVDALERIASSKAGTRVLILSAGYNFLESDRVLVLGESMRPGVYEVLVDLGDSIAFGLVWSSGENSINHGVTVLAW